MDKTRVKKEINALSEVIPDISYDLNDGIVVLEKTPFSSGDEPGTASLMFELPEPYPAEPPALYVPEEYSFDLDEKWLLPGGPDGWQEYALGMPAPNNVFGVGPSPFQWDQEKHTIITVLRLFKASLRETSNDSDEGSSDETDDEPEDDS